MSFIDEKIAQQKLIKVLKTIQSVIEIQDLQIKNLLEKINDLDLRIKNLENYNKDQKKDLDDSYDYL